MNSTKVFPLTKIRAGLYTYRGFAVECMDWRSSAPPDDSNFGQWLIKNTAEKYAYYPTLKDARDHIDAHAYNEPVDNSIHFHVDDGGRKESGYSGFEGDCVVRALAIATGKPYKMIYDRIARGNKTQRKPRKRERKAVTGQYSVAHGVYVGRKWFKDYMKELGFVWTPYVTVGSGCTVHLCTRELPKDGRHVLSLSRHYCAFVDGEVRDVYNPSRAGTRCVYGIWTLVDK